MVVHLGGAFIYSENPKELADWYKVNLGIKYEYTDEYKAYYAVFPYQEIDSGKKAYSCWSIMKAKHRPKTTDKSFCVNLRVTELDKLAEKLRTSGIEVKGVETHDEGKFAWCNDPDGNFIELWEDSSQY